MEPANSLSHPSPPSILAACQPYPDYGGTLGFKGETSHTKKIVLFYKGYCASYMTKFFQILQRYLHQDDLR